MIDMGIEGLIANDQFAKYNGIELTDISAGTATVRMVIAYHYLNGVGIVRGGAIYTLADLAFAATINLYGITAVGLTGNITYFKTETSGILYATAHKISLRHTVATYQVDVTNRNNKSVASLQGTVCRKQ